MRNLFVPILLLFVCLFSACDSRQVYDQYESLPGHWNKDSIVNFQIKNLDTAQAYNLFINIRNTNAYSFQNLFLITQMNFPNGKVLVDTLEYEMAKPDGTWLGTGFSDLKENKLWYKQGVQFSEKGTYVISIRHAMRKNGRAEGVNNLKGITEVGFRIEKSKK